MASGTVGPGLQGHCPTFISTASCRLTLPPREGLCHCFSQVCDLVLSEVISTCAATEAGLKMTSVDGMVCGLSQPEPPPFLCPWESYYSDYQMRNLGMAHGGTHL